MNSPARAERLSDPTEIRFGERIRLQIPVEIEAAAGPRGNGTLADISISGALLETALELPVFTNLVVKLPAPAGAGRGRELAACVVRTSVTGIGIEWRDMACPTLLGVLRDAGCQTTNVAPCDRAFR